MLADYSSDEQILPGLGRLEGEHWVTEARSKEEVTLGILLSS